MKFLSKDSEMPWRDYPLAMVLRRPPLWQRVTDAIEQMRWDWLYVGVILAIAWLFLEIVPTLVAGGAQ